MKNYLIKIVLFFAIIFVVDLAFGKVCDYLRDHTKGGYSGNVHYICEECNEDIIMVGSSRMKHHYVPQIFEDSLGMTCYNAGIDGNGIILSYGFLQMILERYIPKIIIYDVTGYDMYIDDNTKYLDMLRPYYNDRVEVQKIFNDVSPQEKWKMKSSLYRYNSDLFGLVGDNVHPTQLFDKGYWPIEKVMNYEPKKPNTAIKSEIDRLKLQYLGEFITLAKEYGVTLVFVASPTYYGSLLEDYNNPVKDICNTERIPFIDCFYDYSLSSSNNYWSDPTHLNNKGARIFSAYLTKMIKEYI